MTVLELEHTFADRLDDFGAPWVPRDVPAPRLVRLNDSLARELGLDPATLSTDEAVSVLAGARAPSGSLPVAQVYAGHQFGSFNPRLGDGRAVLLGEVVDPRGRRFDVSLKGSGRTPFSRGGDGKAALGPVLREYLMGEAMHALGVPTTRALAAVTTGELVRREGMLPGAVLTRVAASHLRVGTFQFFAARGDLDRLQRLFDFAVDRHDPDLADAEQPALSLLERVAARQASLVARWMTLGFIHGVMNTDNVTISGETIDYGPCAFMDEYDPATVFSSIDHGGRYAYGNQPTITLWNLARLAEALLPLMGDDRDAAVEAATDVLDRFMPRYDAAWLALMRPKLGLTGHDDAEDDRRLALDWLELLRTHRVDMTTAFRRLGDAAAGDDTAITSAVPAPDWFDRWRARLGPDAASVMRAANPVYVPRNHLVEAALEAALRDGDLAPFDELLEVVTDPFGERPGLDRFAEPAPDRFTASYQTFCGT